jgi:hypothetical protein
VESRVQVATRATARVALGLAALASASAFPRGARADDACIAAYERTQTERKAGHLKAALDAAGVCGAAACPRAMAEECSGWARDLERKTPTVVLVFERPDGTPATGAAVTIDDVSITPAPRPVPLDPGEHKIRVVLEGFDPIALSVVAREGEQARPVVARFVTRPTTVPMSTPTRSRTPELAFAGVSLGAFALGTGFGVAALVDYNHLSGSCGHACTPDDAGRVRAKAVVADVSFGVGAAALVTATILYFRPMHDARIGLVASPPGGALAFERALP